jgi:DNA mismatch endonuclease (patch repair protein)
MSFLSLGSKRIGKSERTRSIHIMPDVFSVEVRSRVMSAIRSRGNLKTEVELAKIFRKSGIRGWRRHQNVHGRPDFVFAKLRVAIFVDGCFWHGCPRHGRKPTSNQQYWTPKLKRTRARDERYTAELRQGGWLVIRIWQHELLAPGRVTLKCKAVLARAAKRPRKR